MSKSYDTETPNFADDLRKIRILSFSSYRKSLLYAGFERNRFDNWKLAADFAEAHNMFPIQATEGGEYLSKPDRKIELRYSKQELKRIWDRSSINYCISAEGSVKTFVCGANPDSTFRRKEIHAMMHSHTIDQINGRDHSDYIRLRREVLARLNEESTLSRPERHKRSINMVFRAIALAEIRQDLSEARQQQNPEAEKAVLARIGHLRYQHKTELRQQPRAPELQALNENLSAQEEMTRANPNLHLALYPPRHANI